MISRLRCSQGGTRMQKLTRLVVATALGLAAVVALHPSGIPDASAQPKGGGGGGKGGGDDQGLEFEPESASSTPPSKTLERAVKLYDKKDWYSASIELQ